MVELPEVVIRKVAAIGAEAWLAALPELVDGLLADWELEIDRVLEGGSEALVATVTGVDGAPAVLKVLIPRDGTLPTEEIRVLRHADGRGCVALLRDDETRGALLVEQLGPQLSDLGLPVRRRLEIMADTVSELWHPAPELGLPTGADKARWLAEFVTAKWEQLDRPCSEAVVDHALACAERRAAAHDDARAVLVHGDVHRWNTLQAADGFRLIDPDGLHAEAEYDLGVLLREDSLELLEVDPTEWARMLASRTGLDATAIWEWGVVERVSTGLLCTELELPDGADMLQAAAEVVGLDPV